MGKVQVRMKEQLGEKSWQELMQLSNQVTELVQKKETEDEQR
jgi:hypothetical protein